MGGGVFIGASRLSLVPATPPQRAASDGQASVAEFFQEFEFLREGKLVEPLARGSFALQNSAHPFAHRFSRCYYDFLPNFLISPPSPLPIRKAPLLVPTPTFLPRPPTPLPKDAPAPLKFPCARFPTLPAVPRARFPVPLATPLPMSAPPLPISFPGVEFPVVGEVVFRAPAVVEVAVTGVWLQP